MSHLRGNRLLGKQAFYLWALFAWTYTPFWFVSSYYLFVGWSLLGAWKYVASLVLLVCLPSLDDLFPVTYRRYRAEWEKAQQDAGEQHS